MYITISSPVSAAAMPYIQHRAAQGVRREPSQCRCMYGILNGDTVIPPRRSSLGTSLRSLLRPLSAATVPCALTHAGRNPWLRSLQRFGSVLNARTAALSFPRAGRYSSFPRTNTSGFRRYRLAVRACLPNARQGRSAYPAATGTLEPTQGLKLL